MIKDTKLWIASLIAVIIIFHICYGLQVLIPTNVSWLMTILHDWGTHYLGWDFYKKEPWHFPIGDVRNYYYPVGTNVGFTDSIPLLAIFFKLFAPILPDDFQYFGIWLFLCHLLTAYFTILFLRLFKVPSFYIFIAVIFMVANPVLVYRGLHPALCAQWLLIASLYLYFLPPVNVNRILLYQLILLVLSALINPYICFMVLGFSLIIPLRLCFFDKLIPWKKLGIYLLITMGGIILPWYVTGMLTFEKKEDIGVEGSYGLYGLNLNSLFNSFGFSPIFPALKQVSLHQYEGFMYLGAGMFLLFLILLGYGLYLLVKRKKTFIPHQHTFNNISLIPIYILVIAYTLFSITHVISWNDKVLFRIPAPSLLVKTGEIFRASARFFWTPYYMILLFAIVALAKSRIMNAAKVSILLITLVIQLYDTWPLLTFRHLSYGTYEPPLDNATWSKLMEQSDQVVLYPPFEAHYLTNMDYQYFCYLAAKAGKPVNTGYVARADNGTMKKYLDSLQAIDNGQISSNALYITTPKYLEHFFVALHDNNVNLYMLDKYYVLSKKNISPLTGHLSKVDSVAGLFKSHTQFTSTKMPPVTNATIHVNMETLNDADKFISVKGWAFIDSTSNNKGDSIFFTLANDKKFYVSITTIFPRPDVTGYFKKHYLDDAGFSALIFKDSVEKGKYQIGIMIKDASGKLIYRPTGRTVKVGIPDYTLPQKINLLPAVSDIIYGIDGFNQDSAFLRINGWAAFKNQNADDCEISLILKSEHQLYLSSIEPVLRPDVTAAIKYRLDSTGFKTKILKTQLPKDKYQIGILIKDKKRNKEGMIYTDKLISVF